MPATLFTSRTRARCLGCLFALTLGTGCKNDARGDKGSGEGKGGAAGSAATGGSSGAAAATSGTGPTGGSSGTPTGGTPTGGTSGSASGGATPTGGSSGTAGRGASGGAGGSSGSGGAAGAGGDACANAIFCDDFDDVPANGPPASTWTVQRGGSATAVVDQTHRLSGMQSVKIDVPTGPGRAYITLANAPVFPVTGNAFYGRVMVWLAAAPTTAVHWTLVEAGGLVPMQTYHSLYRLGGQHPITNGNQLMANYETPDGYSNNGPRSDCWHHADRIVVPVARWSCFEWSYDGPSNAITLWVDGVEVLSVRGMGDSGRGDGCVSQSANYAWTAPTFDTLRLGWESYQTDTARTLWLDDVAISTTRIGCPSSMGQ